MDDTESVAIVSVATEMEGPFSSRPELMVICGKKNNLGFFVALHGEAVEFRSPKDIEVSALSIRKPVADIRVRVDKEKPFHSLGIQSPDSVLLRVNSKKMVEMLGHASTLRVEVPSVSGSSGVLTFSVERFIDAVGILPGGCGKE